MAIDFEKWNEQFGGEEAKRAIEDVKNNNREFTELPDGEYTCKLDNMELTESSKHQPMIKAQFRIMTGEHKKQCLFWNQVLTRGFPQHIALEFLRSMNVFDESEIDFNGDFGEFNDLIMDIAEEAQGMRFVIAKQKDGDFTRLTIVDTE